MKSKKPLVGFDRYVEREWLDEAAKLVSTGGNLSVINTALDEFLSPYIEGETSRRKTKNILTATWLKAASNEVVFKQQAVELFLNASKQERLVIHYGMSIASYPFFMAASKILGRLFKLQDEVSNAEFYRRVIEGIGDRESIKRAAARYLQSLIQWGVLVTAGKSAVRPGSKIQIGGSELVTWLYASVLFSLDKERLTTEDVTSDPCWFPFDVTHTDFKVSESVLLEVIHQSVDITLVSLKP